MKQPQKENKNVRATKNIPGKFGVVNYLPTHMLPLHNKVAFNIDINILLLFIQGNNKILTTILWFSVKNIFTRNQAPY